MIRFLGFFMVCMALFQCAQKSKAMPLFLLPLLDGTGTSPSSATAGGTLAVVPASTETSNATNSETNSGSTETAEPQVRLTLGVLPSNNLTGLCLGRGGLFIQYEKGNQKTCGLSDVSPGCATQALDSNSQPVFLDPRSYTSLTLPQGQTFAGISFPALSKSLVYCFDRLPPNNSQSVLMYAYRNRSGGSIANNCPRPMEGEFCNDRLSLFVPTRFQIPKEFPLVTESGQTGNAGSHWLELKYRNESDKYVTCIYGGNGFGGPSGFTPNSYISGNPQAQYRKGYCLVCSKSYCNYGKGGGNGPFTGDDAFDQEYLISSVVGTSVIAKTEILLSVRNGQGATKHTVSWNLQGFEPIESSLGTLPIDAFLWGSMEQNGFWIAFGFILVGLLSGYFWKKRSLERT